MRDPKKLSEGQRECLRRVLVRKNSKEIAIELGISPHTVDQRLRVAIQMLGVSSRFEAARCLAEHESGGPYQPTLYQSPSLANVELLPDPNVGGGDETDRTGQEERNQDLPEAIRSDPVRRPLKLGLSTSRGGRNDLSLWARAGWIFAFAIGTAVAFGTFLTGIKALTDLAMGPG